MTLDELAKHWLGKLTRLNPNTGKGLCHGKAPHKPLLLLAILDMAEVGEFPTRVFTRTPGLVLRFRTYTSLVTERWPTRINVRLPFYHLKNQKFWEAYTAAMQPAASPESCDVCEMDSAFFDLFNQPDFRLKARLILVATYFTPTERTALYETLGLHISTPSFPSTTRLMEEAEVAAKRKGRSARFAIRVCSEYRYTCALTGYRCDTAESTTIVDAAHIESWAESQNDEITNGLALSKNAHWMFDEGLWYADEQLRIVVNTSAFTEQGPDAFRLTNFNGRYLQFDPRSSLRPAAESLKRHRLHFCNRP